MSFTLLTLGLLCARPVQAQGGYPGGGWTVTDNDGNPLQVVGSGYPLTGTATGAAINHYPKEMTDAATAPGYYDLYGEWVDNSQWLQAASGGPHSYDPNPLGAPYLYTRGTTSPSSTSIALNATAHNYAFNNEEYGSFNKGDPPFFLNQIYKNLSDCEPINGDVTGRATGTLWAYWTWMGFGTPPDHLDILLTTNVSASSSFDGNAVGQSGLSATATASDGNPFNETATSDAGVPSVVGHHLLRVPVTGGVAAVSLNGNVKVSATNSVPYGAFSPYEQGYYGGTTGPTGALSYASVSATANIDSREVIIACPEIENSSHSGPLDPATNNYPQDVRAVDGSIVTDSVVSVVDTTIGWASNPYLQAQAVGFQSPVFSWGVSGQGSLSSTGNTPYTRLSVRFPMSTTDTALNKQSTVQVNVTDSDGATAANTFEVRWHYPKENATLFASGQPFWQEAERKSVTQIGYIHGDAVGTFGYSTYADFLPVAAGDIFDVLGHAVEPPWSAFVAAVGLAVAQTEPTLTEPVGCNFDQCWNSPFSTGLPSPLDPALMDEYQMNPLLVLQYQEQTWQYDQYGQKGYLGPAQEKFDVFLGAVQSAGEFSRIGPPPAGGS